MGEFPGVIDKIAARQWQSGDGTKTGVALDVTWAIEDDEAKATTGRDVVTARQGIMLDLTPDGAIDMGEGKNVALGRSAGRCWPQRSVSRILLQPASWPHG
jgi:hypothetical protein